MSRKINIYFCIASLAALMALLPLTGCGNNGAEASGYSENVFSPMYATNYEIKGAPGKRSTIIEVRNPWQGADSIVTQLFIARNGEEPPRNFHGQVLHGDARRIVAMSSTHVAMLDAIGEGRRVVGVSGLDYITSPTVLARRDIVADVGYEGNINYERLVALNPDLVLLYGVNGASPMEAKLRELGIPFLYIGDYIEESPLGKAEWLVAVAETVGKRLLGEETYSAIPLRYNALAKKVKYLSERNPRVMLNTPYGDSWVMPSTRSYMVRLITDAGGKYVYGRNTGNKSEPVDMEQAYLMTSQADVWLNPGKAHTLKEVEEMCPKFTDTPPFVNGRVYNNNARTGAGGGNDYWESGVVHPDVVLRDLVKIFHPSLVEGHELVYYKKLE